MQKRGYTRGGRLCAETGKELVQNALEEVSQEGEDLFVVQQPKRQWQNLASVLGRCFLLVDRRQGEIYMAWEVHITTSRVQGIVAKPTRDRVDNDATWKRAIEWMDADLGF